MKVNYDPSTALRGGGTSRFTVVSPRSQMCVQPSASIHVHICARLFYEICMFSLPLEQGGTSRLTVGSRHTNVSQCPSIHFCIHLCQTLFMQYFLQFFADGFKRGHYVSKLLILLSNSKTVEVSTFTRHILLKLLFGVV